MVYVDYPTASFTARKGQPISFDILGDKRLTCKLAIVRMDDKKLPAFTVVLKDTKEELKGKPTKQGRIEYELNGGQSVKISWK